jgi:hypothetical protein
MLYSSVSGENTSGSGIYDVQYPYLAILLSVHNCVLLFLVVPVFVYESSMKVSQALCYSFDLVDGGQDGTPKVQRAWRLVEAGPRDHNDAGPLQQLAAIEAVARHARPLRSLQRPLGQLQLGEDVHGTFRGVAGHAL